MIKPPTLAIFSNAVITFIPTASLAVSQNRFSITAVAFSASAFLASVEIFLLETGWTEIIFTCRAK
jgi:hypothetical protein